jgi:LacI family transcriptional regulator
VKGVTIRDVAREADVSVASVSRALNGVGRVGPETRTRILRAAERLRYVPHEGARSLSTRRSSIIGVLLPDLHGEFFSELLRGADAAARAEGLQLLVSTSHGDLDEAATALRSMQGRVDGLLLMSPHLDEEFLERNVPAGVPALLLNERRCPSRPALAVADYDAAVVMTRHLAGGGRRRVAHVAGPASNADAAERLRGYLAARPEALGDAYVVRGDFSMASGYAAGLQLAALSPRPDAIFAANDMMAVGCIGALADARVPVPDEIAVGGFDDVPLSSLVRPALTTMRTDVARLGGRALERLAGVIERPDAGDRSVEVITPELIVRDSCGRGGRSQAPASGAEQGRLK